MPFDNVELFPMTPVVNAADHLVLGGCDTVELAREFGSPLLVFDEKRRAGPIICCTRWLESRVSG